MKTREEWLNQATDELRAFFDYLKHPLPDKIRVTCGFPSMQARARKRRIGEHWSAKASTDQTHEIFISPVLDDAVEVFAVLVHELAHAATDGDGHRGRFPKLVSSLFLEGKPSATVAGDRFRSEYKNLLDSLGEYPHARLNVAENGKKQGTRMLKAVCTCGYTIRLTKLWADQGLPTCVCGNEFQLETV